MDTKPGGEADDQDVMSIVSKAAERSSRQRHDTYCDPIALRRCLWMYKRTVSVE